MSSTLLLHVCPGGSGRATIATQLYLSGMRAFDGLFAAQGTAPTRPPQVELEYEGPPQQQAPPPTPAPAAPAAPARPDTEIYLAPLTSANGQLSVGTPLNITNNPGYDNQPFFTPDGKSVLFASARGALSATMAGGAPQTDIYRYAIVSRTIEPITQTAESEYSPTVMPDGARISVVRAEADGRQRLWKVTPGSSGNTVELLLPEMEPVGYQAWADDRVVALFILGERGGPATLQLVDTKSGQIRVIATDIGRSILRMPGEPHRVSFVQRERAGDQTTLTVKAVDPASGAVTTLTPAVEGSREADLAWTPDGTLLMAKDDVLYAWTRGQTGWKQVASLKQLGLSGVTRLAVSPAGDLLAVVASPPR